MTRPLPPAAWFAEDFLDFGDVGGVEDADADALGGAFGGLGERFNGAGDEADFVALGAVARISLRIGLDKDGLPGFKQIAPRR